MKKIKSTHPGKGFGDPFAAEPDYYKTKTYEEVFNAVREMINNNFYTCTWTTELLEPLQSDDPEYLTKMLKELVSLCPDLFESDNPSAKKLVAHFGKLINISFYGQTSKERTEAKNAIDDILSSKAPYAKSGKVINPPLLSLNDMVTYIDQITKYLRKQYIKEYGREPLNKKDIKDTEELERLKKTDKRLVSLIKSGDIEMLIKEPTEFTKKLVAKFVGRTLGGLEQKQKKEKPP